MLSSAKCPKNDKVGGEADQTNRVCAGTPGTAITGGGSVEHNVVVRLVSTGSLQ